MNPSMLKRLIALENIRKTFTPTCGKARSHEHIAGLLTDVYSSLWSSDATLQSREIRYAENLRLVEQWRTTPLVEKLERYQELFNEV